MNKSFSLLEVQWRGSTTPFASLLSSGILGMLRYAPLDADDFADLIVVQGADL